MELIAASREELITLIEQQARTISEQQALIEQLRVRVAELEAGHCQLEQQSCAFSSVGGTMDGGSPHAFRPYAATPTPVTSFQTWNRR